MTVGKGQWLLPPHFREKMLEIDPLWIQIQARFGSVAAKYSLAGTGRWCGVWSGWVWLWSTKGRSLLIAEATNLWIRFITRQQSLGFCLCADSWLPSRSANR
jgi:hypothetical protein